MSAGILAALMFAGSCDASQPPRQAMISSPVNGSTLTVSVHPRVHAGAIDSLTYRGVEYVDNLDHGRQIQSAIQVDDLGECYSPNEAGAKADEAAPRTSSTVRLLTTAGNVLTTETKPAFWLGPREPYGKACSPARPETSAQNNAVLSNYLIKRTTRFYGPAIPNLLLIDISMTFPEQRRSASIEALTGYLPANFTSFYSYDPAARRLQRLQAATKAGRTNIPMIVATPDGRNAFGVFSKAIASAPPDRAYYAYFYFPEGGATAKWACVFGEFGIRAGATFNYSCPIAVGSLKEVTTAFDVYAKASGR